MVEIDTLPKAITQSNQNRPFETRPDFLPFSPPNISEDEIAAVVEVLKSGWITTGPKTVEFEKIFASRFDAETALAVNSCTGALHVALAALGIGHGDEVITTTLTFTASVNVIEHVGATPILVDIEPDTLQMDPALVAKAITPRTKAIIPVHFAGHPVDMDPIMALAREYNLYVIEDAAHSLPAKYKGRQIGSIGDLTAFSFYATKNLTTGEGGMLTGKAELVARARLFSLHGMNRDAWKRYTETGSWYYEVVEPGFKYNMTDIQAAMGLVQLKRLEEMQAHRYTIVERYNSAFRDIPALQIPSKRDNVDHAWHLYVLRLNLDCLNINRADFIKELYTRRVGASVHFIPVHLHPFYANKYNLRPEDFPVAYNEYQRILSLPLNSAMKDADVDYVIAAVKDIVGLYQK